ncbi:MAG TPA: glucosidase, partial [Candidatus Methylomirabilis sp.]|nr:glucosidase [Candidatus Methylomirabilis sp.]
MTAEAKRLAEARMRTAHWKRWGPYLSERQWGTVREDYSAHGSAWDSFPHDHARSRVYRWGEDGLLGISDNHQRLCFSLALWNGKDPILKERLFGLAGPQGNHGEDVKEYYYYLDSTPTHSYMKGLYKYPQAAYPYAWLREENARRGRRDPEFELLDTGVFDDNRYFDVFAEYAKASSDDILIRITVWNRGPQEATLHLLPTLWFRNTWGWDLGAPRPKMHRVLSPSGTQAVLALHPDMKSPYRLTVEGTTDLLFTDNETNRHRLFGSDNNQPFAKDAFHDYLIDGRSDAVNPEQEGTKAAAHYPLRIPPRESRVVRLRLSAGEANGNPFGEEFDRVFQERRHEADEFYATVIPERLCEDAKSVMRQALAGMLW